MHISLQRWLKLFIELKGHHPPYVVWWGVSYEGVIELHFCAQGEKCKIIPR